MIAFLILDTRKVRYQPLWLGFTVKLDYDLLCVEPYTNIQIHKGQGITQYCTIQRSQLDDSGKQMKIASVL